MAKDQWRKIWTSVSLSRKLAKVGPLAALLWTWINPHCDDHGRIQGDAGHIRALVVPRFKEITEETVEQLLMELHTAGLIVVYIDNEDAGKENPDHFIFISNWYEYQTLISGKKRVASKLPEMTKEMKLDVIECNWMYPNVKCRLDKIRVDKSREDKNREKEIHKEKAESPSVQSPPSKVSPGVQEIFDFWNSQPRLVTVRKFSQVRIGAVKVALETYSAEEIKRGIQNYNDAIQNKYWCGTIWTYDRWTIAQFLQRDNGIEKFLEGSAEKPVDIDAITAEIHAQIKPILANENIEGLGLSPEALNVIASKHFSRNRINEKESFARQRIKEAVQAYFGGQK